MNSVLYIAEAQSIKRRNLMIEYAKDKKGERGFGEAGIYL